MFHRLKSFYNTITPARRRVLFGGLALAGAVVLGALALMWRDLQHMRHRNLQHLEMLAGVLEVQASQQLDNGAQALHSMAATLAQQPLTVAQLEALQTQYLLSLRFVRSLALLTLQGQVLVSTSAADRGQRIDLQRLTEQPLAAGRATLGPWVAGHSLVPEAQADKTTSNTGYIPLLLPASLPTGAPVLLVALLQPQAFNSQHQLYTDGPYSHLHLQLLHTNGSLLAPTGQRQPAVGQTLRNHPLFQSFLGKHEGRFGPLAVDDSNTLGAWHRSDKYSFISLVEEPYAATTAEWINGLQGPLLLMAGAILLVVLVTRTALRNAHARDTAQAERDAALQESARQAQELDVLLKNVQELIFRTDAQGLIHYVNPRWQALTHQNTEKALGKPLSALVMPRYTAHVDALFQPGQPEGLRTTKARLARQDGQRHVLDIAVMPLHDREGKLRGYVGSAVDITPLLQAQQSLKEHLAFTERVIDNNPFPVALMDTQGRFVTVNQAWEQFMGIHRDQMLGRTNRELMSAAEAQAYDAHTEQLHHEGGTVRYEERLRRPDGSTRDVQITKTLLRSAHGQRLGILVNKMDITEYLAARDKAQEASRTKSEFVANISHELRTPLQSILGFSELGMVRARQHEKFVSMFSDIHAAGQRMLELVNDLLDISKIESTVGAFHFERNDVRDLIEDVTAELRLLLERKGLALQLELGRMPLISKVDPTRFSQVVRNVLSNAMKFSPEGSTIEISARVQDEQNLLIQIRDHGPGIPPAELEAVFDAFVQSSKTRDGSGGTGLGLAICRKILTAHGGHIHATNAPGGGTVFHIALPTASYTDTMPAPLE